MNKACIFVSFMFVKYTKVALIENLGIRIDLPFSVHHRDISSLALCSPFLYDIYHQKIRNTFIEPVGSSLPKFSSKSNLAAYQEKALHPLALTCPAQGSPLPSFR